MRWNEMKRMLPVLALAPVLLAPVGFAQEAPGQTTVNPPATAAPLTKDQMKAQKKQQKAQEKAAKEQAKAQKDSANALKHQHQATDAAEKAGSAAPAATPPPQL
jgi:hypothetical protein